MPRLQKRKTFVIVLAIMAIYLVVNFMSPDQRVQINYDQDSALQPVLLRTFAPREVPPTNSSRRSPPEVQGPRSPRQVFAPSRGPSSGRLWFMTDGTVRPQPAPLDTEGNRIASLWPDESPGDRIIDQLMFVPPDYAESQPNSTQRLKSILLYNGIGNWAPLKPGQDVFLGDNCPVNTCTITTNRDELPRADAVLFKDHFLDPNVRRHPDQVWILYLLECPYHTGAFNFKKTFNWTATYRHDSDIVAPYEKFVFFDPAVKTLPLQRNYAEGKTLKVAWFVSNCGARNERLKYARQLSRHIEVDIYGGCGSKSCPRTQHAKCFEMLNKDYKFYLSFENSNCRDYITEKFFVNGLGHDIVPIVMGAHKEDYERAAPPHSFISVDDFDTPKALATYLHMLDANDTLYNEYFAWKGTGEFVNTHFWCRMCALLHDKPRPKVYDNIETWWRHPGACVTNSWRHPPPQLGPR